MGLGPAELVVLLFLVAILGLPVWAVADAARSTDRQWAAVGQSRTVWLILLVVLTVAAFPFGILLSVVYLLTVRPKLATAAGPATD
jgi:hypothetical protein